MRPRVFPFTFFFQIGYHTRENLTQPDRGVDVGERSVEISLSQKALQYGIALHRRHHVEREHARFATHVVMVQPTCQHRARFLRKYPRAKDVGVGLVGEFVRPHQSVEESVDRLERNSPEGRRRNKDYFLMQTDDQKRFLVKKSLNWL